MLCMEKKTESSYGSDEALLHLSTVTWMLYTLKKPITSSFKNTRSPHENLLMTSVPFPSRFAVGVIIQSKSVATFWRTTLFFCRKHKSGHSYGCHCSSGISTWWLSPSERIGPCWKRFCVEQSWLPHILNDRTQHAWQSVWICTELYLFPEVKYIVTS